MNTAKDIVYLVACAINEIPLDTSRIKKIDFDYIFPICFRQSLAPIIYYAIKDVDDIDVNKWKVAYYKNLKKNYLMETERNEIFKFMDANNIWRLPLKGIILQNCYPKAAMREMSDNDILYDAKFEDQLNKYMKARGYKSTKDYRLNDYKKKPCYHFEMHRILYNEHSDPKFSQYYKNFKRLLKGDGLSKHLSDEDFYIFQTCHHLWHDNKTGSGLRPLIDLYLYLKNTQLDFNYVNKELKKLGAEEFEKDAKNFAFKLFEKPQENLDLNDDELNRLDFVMNMTAYGSLDYLLYKRFKEIDEQNIPILKYAFPSLKFLQDKNIPYAKHKALLPVYWIRYNCKRIETFGYSNIKKYYKKWRQNKK